MDVVDSLDRTFAHTRGVIAGVSPEQYGASTPCEDWTVQDLLNHVISVVDGIGKTAAGEKGTGEFELAADPATQFDAAAAANVAAWRAPGALDREVNAGPGPMPGHVLAGINLLDTATHAWDLARATGQDPTLPDDVAAAAMEACRAIVTPELRPGRFGPEVRVSAEASQTDQLVAFLGRQP